MFEKWMRRSRANRKANSIGNASIMEMLDTRAMLSAAAGQVFIPDSGNNAVGQYDTDGNTVNASLITGLNQPSGIAVSGGDIFVVSSYAGTVSEYTTSGSVVNASLITGLDEPNGIAVSGSHIFISQYNYNNSTGFVGEYTITGATVKASLISGLEEPAGLAVSGSDLFVADEYAGTIGEYTISGSKVNASLISGLQGPTGIAISGSDLFVTENYSSTVGEYTVTGSPVNASLISGFQSPDGIAVLGQNLFVQDDDGIVGEYSATDGSAINANLLSLGNPVGIAVIASQGSQQQTSGPALVFNQQPSDAIAGSALNPSVSVEALDANGNVATTDKSKVTLTLSSGGKLIGTASAPLKNGLVTFNKLSIDKAGTYTITAADSTYASAVSNSFTISASAVKKILFNPQPASISSGTPFNVSVRLLDQYGNAVDDGSTANLVLGAHPKNAQSLNLTATVSDGSAEFDGVTLDTPGTYSLQVMDGKKATSKKFVLT